MAALKTIPSAGFQRGSSFGRWAGVSAWAFALLSGLAQADGPIRSRLSAQAPAPAQAPPAPPAPRAQGAGAAGQGEVGRVTHLSGALVAKHADGTVKYLSASSGVIEGDTLATQDGAYARVKFIDGAQVVLRPSSRLKVDVYRFVEDTPGLDSVALRLQRGGLRKVTGLIGRRNRERVRVVTPNAALGIAGTHFGMLFCQGDCDAIRLPGGGAPLNGLHLDVALGAVTVTNAAGTQRVNAGQFAYAPPDASAPPAIVPPGQGIQVTMPQAIARNVAAGRSAGAVHSDDGCPTR